LNAGVKADRYQSLWRPTLQCSVAVGAAPCHRQKWSARHDRHPRSA